MQRYGNGVAIVKNNKRLLVVLQRPNAYMVKNMLYSEKLAAANFCIARKINSVVEEKFMVSKKINPNRTSIFKSSDITGRWKFGYSSDILKSLPISD